MAFTNDLPEPVSLDQTAVPMSEPLAANRAATMTYALNEVLPKTYTDIYRSLLEGKEDDVRREATATIDLNNNLQVQRMLAGQNTPVLSLQDWNSISKPKSNPDTVVEQQYGKKYISELDSIEDSPLHDLNTVIPNQVKETKILGETRIAQRMYAIRLAQDVDEEVQNQGIFPWLADQAKGFIPGYQEVKLRGNVKGVSIFSGGLLGENLANQARELYLNSPDLETFAATLNPIVENLRKDNPSVASAFLAAVIGQSTSERLMNDSFTMIDLTAIKGGVDLIKSATKWNATRRAVKDIVQGVAEGQAQGVPPQVAAPAVAGNLEKAAVNSGTINTVNKIEGAYDPTKAAKDAMHSVFKPEIEAPRSNPGNFGQENVNRMEQIGGRFYTNLLNVIEKVAKVERTPVLRISAEAQEALAQEISGQFRGQENAILDISKPYKNNLTNTLHSDVHLGTHDAKYFESEKQAQVAASHYNLSAAEYHIEQSGAGYYINVPKPIDETLPAVRNFLTTTKETLTPDSMFSTFFGWLRTPEETLSVEQRMNRKIATYAPAALMEVAKENAKEIAKLARWTFPGTERKQRWLDWERTIKAARDMYDPTILNPGPKDKGYFFKTPGELETFYTQTFNRLPIAEEVNAYFAYKRMVDMDWALRNISVYRNMSRVGAQEHRFFITNSKGERVWSDYFTGVERKVFPGGEDPILIVGGKVGEERVYRGGAMPPKTYEKYRKGVETGQSKVFEIYDINSRPLAGWSDIVGDIPVRYVVVPSGKTGTKPLDFIKLNRRGGGHFEYDYEHYVKQAMVMPVNIGSNFRNRYEGDATFAAFMLKAQGEDVAQKMNVIARLIREDKKAEAKAFAQANIPIEWKKLRRWFRPTVDPVTGKKSPARFSTDPKTPFEVVPRGKMIIDRGKQLEDRFMNAEGKTTFEDGTRKGSLASQYQVQFTSERDADELFTFRDVGTKYNPVYQYEPAKLIDPIPSMNRALSRIVNSTFMDDYKIFSMEHWIQEFAGQDDPSKGILSTPLRELRYSPFYYFNHPEYKSGVDPAVLQKAQIARYQIQQFSGVASTTDALLHSMASKMADSIYKNFGPKALPLDPSWMLPRLRDPARFIRGVTFDAKLGLFAWPQILVQNQTYVTILGVAGAEKAVPGTYAALLHQWSRLNPTMIDTLDKYASKLHIPGTSRWKPGEWKEANEAARSVGFGHVGGEFALRDNVYSHKVFETSWGQFLNAGRIFFTEGERSVRLGAWYTAFREFRDKFPTGKLTEANLRSILERADTLYVNMSRASNSVLQHGAFSIPTQFLSYQVRAAELFTGKRLTKTEKARLFTTYATVYGLPTALGVTGFPVGDFFRKQALEHGYVVGDSYLQSAIMEGVPSFLTGITTGVYPNIGERYGTQGLEFIREALRSDVNLWEVIFGAAGSVFGNTWENSDGFVKAVMSAYRGDGQFPFMWEDVIDIFKEITSVNQTYKGILAANTGKLLSKKGTYLGDATKLGAILQTATGLQDQRISDLNLLSWSKEDTKNLQKDILNRFVQEFRRGITAFEGNNMEQGKRFFSRAFRVLELGDYPEEKIASAIALASNGQESLIERMNKDYFLKDIQQSQKQQKLETYKRFLRTGGH